MSEHLLNGHTFSLFECTVRAYEEDASNPLAPTAGDAVNLGLCQPSSIRQQTLVRNITTTPTGARRPKGHAMVLGYVLSFDRTWLLERQSRPEVPPEGWQAFELWTASGQRMVIDLCYEDEVTGDWLLVRYKGVTLADSSEIAGTTATVGFTESQRFHAEEQELQSGTMVDEKPW